MKTGRATEAASPREGVYYAEAEGGLVLPVIDVQHPAFAVSLDADAQLAFIEAFMREQSAFTALPGFIGRPLLRFLLRGSRLGRGIAAADGTFLSGMSTYLFKLGPDNLGSFAGPIDRKIAASAPAFGMRLRLSDVAGLLADAAEERLRSVLPSAPLELVEIAGGSAMDALNALMIVRRRSPGVLEGRHVEIHVLDLDAAGAAFGRRALTALQATGAPLAGLDVHFDHVSYDWQRPAPLCPLLDAARSRDAVVLVSSEGGLFDYGTDAAIVANLGALRAGAGAGLAVTGSTTRADAPVQKLRRTSRVSTTPRDLNAFRGLVARAGFRLERALERPFSDHWLLVANPD
jgi:hypothetical protein